MKNYAKFLSLLLVLAMLLCAMPALAANEQTDAAQIVPTFWQLASNTKLYTGAGTKTGTLLSLAKNTVVLAFEAESGFTRVQGGGQEGYVSSKSLKAVNAAATVLGVVHANSNATLLSSADAKSKKAGQLKSGEILPSLLVIGSFTAVRQGSLLGFVATKELTAYTEGSKLKGYLLYSKATNIKAGPAAADKKLAAISAGDLVELLYTSGSAAIVRRGKTIGVASTQNTTPYNGIMEAMGMVEATSETTMYAGASTKAAKVGSLKKNDIVEKLGVYGSYTIVRADGVIGLVATKPLKEVQQGMNTDTPDKKPTIYPAITTKTIIVTEDVAAYKSASTSDKFTIVSAGTECVYIETTKDSGWVKVTIDNNTWFIERKYVKEPGALKTAAQSTTPSTSTLPAVSYPDTALEFIDIMNANREDLGQKSLKVDDTLMRAAAIRAQELVIRFAHIRPNGLEPNTVHNMITGENIARGSISLLPDAQSMAEGFMGSSDHKKIAMSSMYTKTGAYYVIESGKIYWVQLFAQ